MPIYEFYCPDCHTIYSFFARRMNTTKKPACPACGRAKLDRQVSSFATTGRAGDGDEVGDLPVDEATMERAMEALASDSERIDEDDPRQAADLMRKFSKMTGLKLGDGMEEALSRIEAGEDPDAVEAELGEAMENDEPFQLPGKAAGPRRPPPKRDETLYDL